MTTNSKRVAILAIAMALAAGVGGRADGQQTSAARAFEQFRKLEGTWRGKSTKGWTDRVTFKTIARGSVVRESSFDSDGGHDAMETLYQMDGSRLVLTHYCEARNQPRMVASEIADDGRTVLFTFLDGLNIPSRDTGHMDKAFFRFVDDHSFVSRWTWYEKGRETWFEDITYVREPAATR